MLTDVITAFEQNTGIFVFCVALLGLMIGSFLNVVIYRLPLMMQRDWACECRDLLEDELDPKKIEKDTLPENFSLALPASSCPNCQHKITLLENIPVISWLMLRGKCSSCKTKISARYPIIEAVTAILSVVVALHFGVTWQTLAVLPLTWALISLTLIDFDHMILPDQITLPLIWLGLLINLNGLFVPLEDAVIGAMAGYMSLFSVYWLFKLVTGKEGMGFGDFKLMAVFGAWLGWQLLPILILMASVVGAIVGISMVLFSGHKRDNAIPFGPYIAVAGWITLLWGQSIWQWYLSFLGY